jgi:hypothetical protein
VLVGNNSADFSLFLKIPNIFNILSAENDSKQYTNTFKYLLNTSYKKKLVHNLGYMYSNNLDNTGVVNPENAFSNSMFNTNNTLKFKDYKSSNAQFLGSERTVRLLTNLNSSLYK